MGEVEGGSFSDEERAEAEKFNASRKENENRWEDLVDKRNENRSLMQRALKKGIVTSDDVMHEEALRENEMRDTEETMEKVVDISGENIGVHHAPASRVEKILEQGLLSPRLAIRSQDYEVKTTLDFASFFPFMFGGLKTVHFVRGAKAIGSLSGARGNVSSYSLGVVIDTSRLIGPIRGDNYDSFVQRRIRPNAVIGLGLSELFYERDKRGWPTDKLSKERTKGIITIAKKLKLPVYGKDLGLVSPRVMTHDEVKQFVAEREEKKKAEEGEESNTSTG